MSKTETTETRFTPGPWKAEYFDAHDLWDVSAPSSPDQFGNPDEHYSVLDDPTEANARLIAASPEMYEALEWCGHVLNGVLGDPDWKDEPDAIKAYEWVHQILARVRGRE